jgi:hypothetical protein
VYLITNKPAFLHLVESALLDYDWRVLAPGYRNLRRGRANLAFSKAAKRQQLQFNALPISRKKE